MKKWSDLKKIIIIVTIVIFLMTGCLSSNRGKEYTGEYPELYSVAINSLLGAKGYELTGRMISSEVRVVDEDSCGRKLFYYYEFNEVSCHSLVVCQYSDDKYSYFYPDYNFISIPEGVYIGEDFKWLSEEDFATEDIEELKRQNDWDKELDLDKCVQVEITHKKDKGPVKSASLAKFYNDALGEDAHDHRSRTYFFTTDDYGRSIYLGEGYTENDNRFIVMLFQSDTSYDESLGLMELEDTENYQDALKEFKDRNSWGKPLE